MGDAAARDPGRAGSGQGDAEALHAAIAAYLRARRHLSPQAAAPRCARCGVPIAAGDSRFDPALLWYARRCPACYAREYPPRT